MSIGKFFEELETAIFSPIERAAEAVVHFEEKEVHMLTEEFSKLFDGIKAAFGRVADSKSKDAQTIKDLQAANDQLTGQVKDLTSQLTDTRQQLTDTQQQLSDAKDQLTSLLNLAEQVEPDPAAAPAQ